jgi:hypothetical protein
MRGLMTGGAAATAPGAIPYSLVCVVQNAIALAWGRLQEKVGAGDFSICGAHEDVITEKLYMILGELHAAGAGEVGGFAMFETPVREGNLRNCNGQRPDCQPDLTFRPLRGHIPTSNSALAGIFVECKPIDSAHPIPSCYCAEGLIRFVRGDYAWAVDRALMVGYVRNQCELPGGLQACIKKDTTGRYRFLQPLAEDKPTIRGERVWRSRHERSFPKDCEPAPPITLYHLWLHPEEPCEQTKCRNIR